MLLLYALLAILLISALSLIAVPFMEAGWHHLLSLHFWILSIFTVCTALLLYHYSSDMTALEKWLVKGGKEHYALQVMYNQLGGIDGIILKIENKLKENPNDLKGWLILHKLYRAKGEDIKAKNALNQARLLQNKTDQN